MPFFRTILVVVSIFLAVLYVYDTCRSDGLLMANDSVTIDITVNGLPTADAGADFSVLKRAAVSLPGLGIDPDGTPLLYTWSQVSGPGVTLSGATGPKLSSTAMGMSALTLVRIVGA